MYQLLKTSRNQGKFSLHEFLFLYRSVINCKKIRVKYRIAHALRNVQVRYIIYHAINRYRLKYANIFLHVQKDAGKWMFFRKVLGKWKSNKEWNRDERLYIFKN